MKSCPFRKDQIQMISIPPEVQQAKKRQNMSELQKGSSLSFWSKAKVCFLAFKRSLPGVLARSMNRPQSVLIGIFIPGTWRF